MKIWSNTKKILVILAHPDDPEFFCGATIAKWVCEGHQVSYVLFTKGEKGVNENFTDSKNIISKRKKEQIAAAEILGVKSIEFLDYEDGMLIPSLEARLDTVREIRKKQPDIVVTCDPTNYFIQERYINHPDHRAAGQIVIDSVFPASQNELYFPELLDEGLKPHNVEEVWLSLPKEPNMTLDITDTWGMKLKALEKHASQIGEIDKFRERMASRASYTDVNNIQHYEEKFNRIVFLKR